MSNLSLPSSFLGGYEAQIPLNCLRRPIKILKMGFHLLLFHFSLYCLHLEVRDWPQPRWDPTFQQLNYGFCSLKSTGVGNEFISISEAISGGSPQQFKLSAAQWIFISENVLFPYYLEKTQLEEEQRPHQPPSLLSPLISIICWFCHTIWKPLHQLFFFFFLVEIKLISYSRGADNHSLHGQFIPSFKWTTACTKKRL